MEPLAIWVSPASKGLLSSCEAKSKVLLRPYKIPPFSISYCSSSCLLVSRVPGVRTLSQAP
jgi:hypothetical protein